MKDAVEVYRAGVRTLEEEGHSPFLFAAMGSHRRGSADGQRDLLRSLGVTEEKMGAPVLCSDEVVSLGETISPRAGSPVYVAREAREADGVLAVNRVKPHASFYGPHDSPEFEGVTGCYFDGTREARANRQAYEAGARRKLWALSEELCASFLRPVR